MFSYRHAFHAGNHADVLKHAVLVHLLEYMGQKETPYMVIDTHAGAGMYELDGGFASKSAEYETGIARLWDRDDTPDSLAGYMDLVEAMNHNGHLRYYPGSPYIANALMRDQDKLRVFELHSSESRILETNIRHMLTGRERGAARGKRIMGARANGFAEMKALLPPPSRRALVLIDPPYEDKQDYQHVYTALQDAMKRFPAGMYAVWYPYLNRNASHQLPEKLKTLGAKSWINVRLAIGHMEPDGIGGLMASGMFILNPPWTLEATLKEMMPYLVDALGIDDEAEFVLECQQG